METLYPMGYGTRLVPFSVIEATFRPHMHPEGWVRFSNFILHQGGKFGPGGGRRLHGQQPDKPGFAKEGESFHQDQPFPSGSFYVAIDFVVVNPGYVHRAPHWSEVPIQGSEIAAGYGWHMNVGKPGEKGAESWHGQPVPLDGWKSWVNAGRPDLQYGYPIRVRQARPQPPQPPTPPTQPKTKEILVEVNSRNLVVGNTGPDVKFFQKALNDIAMQGLLLDGHYFTETERAVANFQRFFKKTSDGKVMIEDGKLGAITQQGIFEILLKVS